MLKKLGKLWVLKKFIDNRRAKSRNRRSVGTTPTTGRPGAKDPTYGIRR